MEICLSSLRIEMYCGLSQMIGDWLSLALCWCHQESSIIGWTTTFAFCIAEVVLQYWRTAGVVDCVHPEYWWSGWDYRRHSCGLQDKQTEGLQWIAQQLPADKPGYQHNTLSCNLVKTRSWVATVSRLQGSETSPASCPPCSHRLRWMRTEFVHRFTVCSACRAGLLLQGRWCKNQQQLKCRQSLSSESWIRLNICLNTATVPLQARLAEKFLVLDKTWQLLPWFSSRATDKNIDVLFCPGLLRKKT